MSRGFGFIMAVVVATNLYAQSIAVKGGVWNFVGVSSDVNISELNVSADQMWSYRDGTWGCNKNCSNVLSELKSGDGFWLKSAEDKNITLQDIVSSEKSLGFGWSMFSPVNKDFDVDVDLNTSGVVSVWSYDNSWSLWTPSGIHLQTGLNLLETLKVGQGAWIHKIDGVEMIFGNDFSVVKNGSFANVIKSSSDSIDDIWNVKIAIDESVAKSASFNLGVEVIKSSGAKGHVVFKDVNINNSVLTDHIRVYGFNADGTPKGGSTYTISTNKEMVESALSYKNGVLSVNFGTVMNLQTYVDKASFTNIGTYSFKIIVNDSTFSGDVLKEATSTSVKQTLAYFPEYYPFEIGSSSMIGSVEIK